MSESKVGKSVSKEMRRGSAILVAALAALTLMLGACNTTNSTKPKPKSNSQLAADALKRGLAAHAAGNLELAVKDYNTVLAYEPRNAFAFYNLGLVAQTRGQNSTAENAYRLAIGADPTFVRAIFNLAIVLVARGDTGQAITLYRRVIALSPKEANAHLNLGLVLKRIGKTAEGNAEIAKALQLDPKLAKRISSPAPAASSK